MKVFFYFLFIIWMINQTYSQSWSDPISISSSGINQNPTFTIDSEDVIHCVWTKVLGFYYTEIYYARSADNGLTWSIPIQLTQNPGLRLEHPQIASDSHGNLFVSYDYDINAYPYVKIHYIVFNRSDSSWTPPIEIATGSDNRIIIDRNDRVYFFWFGGNEHYAYLENNVLSNIFSLSNWFNEPCFLDGFCVDANNKIHCIGNRKAGNYSRGAYFSFFNEEWTPYKDLSDFSFYECALSLNSIGEPAFVWRQILPENHSYRATYFSTITGDSIQSPVQLAEKTKNYPSITIDQSDRVHIVDCRLADSIYLLTHRFQNSDGWTEYVIEENIYTYNKTQLLFKNPYVYLVYDRIDTTSKTDNQSVSVLSIVLRKLEIPQGNEEKESNQEFKIYPNPFTDFITFEWNNLPLTDLSVTIYTIHGKLVFTKTLSPQSFKENKFIWHITKDNTTSNTDEIFIVRLSARDFTKSFKLLRVK